MPQNCIGQLKGCQTKADIFEIFCSFSGYHDAIRVERQARQPAVVTVAGMEQAEAVSQSVYPPIICG